jgi:hypothetical protein
MSHFPVLHVALTFACVPMPFTEEIKDFKVCDVCTYLEQQDFPPEAVSAIRKAHVTGSIILGGFHSPRVICGLMMRSGINDEELAEIGIQSKLLRKSIIQSFASLLQSKGTMMI